MKSILNRLRAMKPRELDRLREAVDIEMERREAEAAAGEAAADQEVEPVAVPRLSAPRRLS